MLVVHLQRYGKARHMHEGFHAPPTNVTVMQFNMRVDNPLDWIPLCSGKSWSADMCLTHTVAARSHSFAACIAAHSPSILGTQEGLYSQVEDTASILEEHHNLDYAYLGIGRRGEWHSLFADAETSAIFYKRSEWTVEATGNFMFSDTPTEIYSSYDSASFPMISTWAVLISRTRDGRRFLAVSTHLDPYSPSVREQSAKQLLDTVTGLFETYSCTQVVLLGDFNSGAMGKAHHVFSPSLVDAFVSDHGEHGKDSFTYHDFEGPAYQPQGNGPRPGYPGQTLSDPNSPVDFIMVKGMTVMDGSTLVDKSQYKGIWPSDHYPVVAALQIPNSSYWSEAPGYSWEPVHQGEALPPNSVSSGGDGFVGRHVLSGTPGEISVSGGVAAWLREPGYQEVETSTDIEALVLCGQATSQWIPVKAGDEVPLGAVFTGFNSKDFNMYVVRVRIGGKYETCKLTSDGHFLGRLGHIYCWKSSYNLFGERFSNGEILVMRHPKQELPLPNQDVMPAKQTGVVPKQDVADVADAVV